MGRGGEPKSNLPEAVKQAGSATPIFTFLVTHRSSQALTCPLRLCCARISAASWRVVSSAGHALKVSCRAFLKDCSNPFRD